jgi:hypothetical protein
LTDHSELEQSAPKQGLVETAAGLLGHAALAGFVTTAFGFPAVIYRLQSVNVPLTFMSNADALTAGLIPATFLGLLYLGFLAILRIMRADTPGRAVSTVITAIGALLGTFAFLIPLLVIWIIWMLGVGATTPLLHIFHLSYLVHRHEIPQSDVDAAFRHLSIWPFAILFLMYVALRVAMHHGLGLRWLESVRQWFSKERMTRHFTVCALLAVIVGLAVTIFSAAALSVITTVAIREFRMSTLSTMTSLLLSLTFGVVAFCAVLVFGPGSREGLRNLKPVGVAVYLVIVVWYSVRFYSDIPQWLGGGRAVAVVLWVKAEDAPALFTQENSDWSAAEDGHGLIRIEANMLYATAETVVLLGRQVPPAGIVISRHSVTALKGG